MSNTFDEDLDSLFSGPRSDTARRIARSVVEALQDSALESSAKDLNEWGWMRPRDITNALEKYGNNYHPTQIYRVLDKLVQRGILEKRPSIEKHPGKGKSISYRLKLVIPSTVWMSRDELMAEVSRVNGIVEFLLERLVVEEFIREKIVPDVDTLYALLDIRDVCPLEWVKQRVERDNPNQSPLKPSGADLLIDWRINKDRKDLRKHHIAIHRYFHKIRHGDSYPHPHIKIDIPRLVVNTKEGSISYREED